MKNYVLADISRLVRRIPRIVVLTLIYIGALIFFIYCYNTAVWNSVTFITTFTTCFSVVGILIGMTEFLFVYASDFKAKVMQMAIGRGLSRPKVVLAKFLEVGIMNIMSLVILCIITLIFGFVTGIHLNGNQVYELAIIFVMTVMEKLIYTAITSIFLFLLQNAGLSALLYVIVGLDPLRYLVALLSPHFKIVVALHLKDYCYGMICNLFQSNLILGKFNFGALVGILIYIVGAYLITVAIFRKKELEF